MGLVKINGKVVTEMGFKVQEVTKCIMTTSLLKEILQFTFCLTNPKGLSLRPGWEINKPVQELIHSKHPEKYPL